MFICVDAKILVVINDKFIEPQMVKWSQLLLNLNKTLFYYKIITFCLIYVWHLVIFKCYRFFLSLVSRFNGRKSGFFLSFFYHNANTENVILGWVSTIQRLCCCLLLT